MTFEIGGVVYTEAGADIQRELIRLSEEEPDRKHVLENEAAVIHAIHREFPVVRVVTLPDPDTDRVGRYHKSAGPTEHDAAVLARPGSGTARRRVLDAIAESKDGMTDEELSLTLELRLYTAAPRRGELLRDGWVQDSGRTRPTSTGTKATVWVLTRAGRDQWTQP